MAELRKRSEAGLPVVQAAHPALAPIVSRENEQGPTPLVALEDTEVEVHWAEQKFAPVPYNSFGVGPLRATVMVRKGESVASAVYRMWLELDAVAARIRVETGTRYLQALEEVTTQARSTR